MLGAFLKAFKSAAMMKTPAEWHFKNQSHYGLGNLTNRSLTIEIEITEQWSVKKAAILGQDVVFKLNWLRRHPSRPAALSFSKV